ncbi:MAG TPA: PHB depolymerase family esterase [Herbaspirillum sp.]
MKFRNPFLAAMMRATRSVTRKTTIAMQKRAMNMAISAIHQSLKRSLPDAAAAAKSKSPPIKDINPRGDAYAKSGAPSTFTEAPLTAEAEDVIDIIDDATHVAVEADQGRIGQFVARSLTNAAGTRSYKLYIPASYSGQPMPLLVMLHGCKQDSDDFASGTRMNDIAERAGCFVVYPEQNKSANGQKCWNWFNAIDQQRDRGEASIIADITRTVIEAYGCDRDRIFVAGLSAGGAMAVVMGNRYPDLYCAVGVHSGLPYAAARDLSSAMKAMRRGADKLGNTDQMDYADQADHIKALPVIVFHDDHDKTVHPSNGEQIIEQALAHIVSTERTEQGRSAGSSPAYTRAIYEDVAQRPLAELWRLHGTAHAWSGGSATGSYTAPEGPDASKEMMRFFKTAGSQ